MQRDPLQPPGCRLVENPLLPELDSEFRGHPAPSAFRTKSLGLALFATLLFMVVSTSHAFEKKKHPLFSNYAVSLYESCIGRSLPGELTSAFSKGSEAEDNFLSWTRLTNWHFYNEAGNIGYNRKFLFFRCYGANDNIFDERVRTLRNMVDSKAPKEEIYAIAGRIAHHIQDMCSPPHVMPIYHAGGDKFDKYKPAREPIADVTAICKELKTGVVEPHELLRQAAQNTRRAVKKPVFGLSKTFADETWLKFWGGPDDEDLPGFRTYGPYDNQFGEIPPCNSDVCRSYGRDIFDEVFTERYLRAVIDTVRLLVYLDQLESPGN